MKLNAFDKGGTVKIYAFEISKAEIESIKWNELDQRFFESCSRGTVSRQLLGLSILAKRLEDSKPVEVRGPDKWFKGKKSKPSDPTSGQAG